LSGEKRQIDKDSRTKWNYLFLTRGCSSSL
jgi:hypothetical protein